MRMLLSQFVAPEESDTKLLHRSKNNGPAKEMKDEAEP